MNWLKKRKIRKLEKERERVKKMEKTVDETWTKLLEEWGQAKEPPHLTVGERSTIDDEYAVKSEAFEAITNALFCRQMELTGQIIDLRLPKGSEENE